jgi:hypothetical protein
LAAQLLPISTIMNVGPPPLPSFQSQPSGGFARQAGHACLAAPLIVIGLSLLTSNFSQNHRDASGAPLLLIFGFVEVAFFLGGTLLGVLAIVLAKPGQRTSVIRSAVCGLALLGLLAAIAVPNFVRARSLALQRNQSIQELHSAVVDVRTQAAAALTNGGKTTVDSQEVFRSLNRLAENGSGDTAAVANGSQLFLKRLQSYQRAYSRAASELTAAKVLTASNLTQRAQIADRKAIVQKFLDANHDLKTFLVQSKSNYRQEMTAAGISPEQIQAALNGFGKNWDSHGPFIVIIRETDDDLGHAMLGVLNLFDTQWGQWSYDTSARLVRFQDHTTLVQYNALMAEIKQAASDQAAAQKRLAALLSQPTSSF